MPMVFAQPTAARPAPSLSHCSPGRGRAPCNPIFRFFRREEGGRLQLSGWICGPHGWVAAASVGSGSWKGPQGLGVDSWVGSGRGSIVDGCRPGSLHGGTWGGRGPQRGGRELPWLRTSAARPSGSRVSFFAAPLHPSRKGKSHFSPGSVSIYGSISMFLSQLTAPGGLPQTKGFAGWKGCLSPCRKPGESLLPSSGHTWDPKPCQGLRSVTNHLPRSCKPRWRPHSLTFCAVALNKNSDITLEWESESPAGEGKRDSSPRL